MNIVSKIISAATIGALALTAGVGGDTGSTQAHADDAPVVVELFTSQGCSSCPPADALLGELTRRADVIALTMPVDYWDYNGWKDTLASPAYTNRQHSYARLRGDSKVYTPQMVFNGRTHAVGSQRGAVEQAISNEREAAEGQSVAVTIGSSDDEIMVTVAGRDGDAPHATIWLLLTSKTEDVQIGRGENSGRTVTYYNVVRMMMPIGQWQGEALETSLPKTDLMEGYDGCTVILQVDGAGPILGAAYLDNTIVASN